MMEYEAVRQRQDEIRRSVERSLLAMSVRPARRPLRISVGTGLARLGLMLAGRTAVRAVLGEAR
jgi:tRNA1(Val) A37 N6-methylase TrmN6